MSSLRLETGPLQGGSFPPERRVTPGENPFKEVKNGHRRMAEIPVTR
jgi:hypothetical protein